MKASDQKNVLLPGRVYEVGSDCPLGYYLFSNYVGSEKDKPLSHNSTDAEFHMYETYPPDLRHTFERGYFGFANVRLGQKFIRLEGGAAIYYGDTPFDLYEVLSSVDLSDSIFCSKGVAVMSSELCTIKVFKRNRQNIFYHADTDAMLSDQFLFSINGHNFWAGTLNVKSYKSYKSVIYGLRDTSTDKVYWLGDEGLHVKGISNVRSSIKDFSAFEMPEQVFIESVDIEWVKLSCSSRKLYRSSADIKQIYSEGLGKLAATLQKYCDLGLLCPGSLYQPVS